MRAFGICILLVLSLFCGRSSAGLSTGQEHRLKSELIKSGLPAVDANGLVQILKSNKMTDTQAGKHIDYLFYFLNVYRGPHIDAAELAVLRSDINGTQNRDEATAKNDIEAIERLVKPKAEPKYKLDIDDLKSYIMNASETERIHRIEHLITGARLGSGAP